MIIYPSGTFGSMGCLKYDKGGRFGMVLQEDKRERLCSGHLLQGSQPETAYPERRRPKDK